MKSKRPLIYLAAAILAALVILAIENPSTKRVGDVSDNYFIPKFDPEKIVRVEIEQLTDGVDLKLDGKEWMVSGRAETEKEWKKADGARVLNALGTLGVLGEGVVVSDNPEKQAMFRVDVTGLTVRAFDAQDKPVFNVVIGKNGPDFMSNYLRRADETKVYLVNRPLTGVFSPRPEDWQLKDQTAPQ